MSFEMTGLTPSALPPGQGMWHILRESFQQYFRHGWTLTRPLLLPVLKINLGAYACIILNYLFVNEQSANGMAMHFGWVLAGMAVITALTLWPFLTGFWEYLVLFVSLNRNAAEVFCGQTVQIKPAYDLVLKENTRSYQLLLAAYFLIPLGVILFLEVLAIVAIALAKTQGQTAVAGAMLSFILIQLLGGLIALIIGLLLTFVFQIAAFEKLPPNPLPTLLQSARMAWRRLPATFGLQIILAVLTSILAPALSAWLSRLLWISTPLDNFHQWLTRLIIQGVNLERTAQIPYYGQLFETIQGNIAIIAANATDVLIGTITTALLLPLGTLAFTRLYWDIRFSK